LYAGTQYPVLAALPVSLSANAMAFHAFTRSFGQAWGITIGSTILSNELNKKLKQAGLENVLGGGDPYQSIPLIGTLCVPTLILLPVPHPALYSGIVIF
jgi:hypothetical protein